jgi:hypothetical protein
MHCCCDEIALLDRNTRDFDVLERLVALVRSRLLDVVDDLEAGSAATEDAVSVEEMQDEGSGREEGGIGGRISVWSRWEKERRQAYECLLSSLYSVRKREKGKKKEGKEKVRKGLPDSKREKTRTHQGHGTVVMKNWLPFVFGPAFAIESM